MISDNIFFALIIIAFHCIGDFPLQGEFLAVNKSKDKYILFCHCMIHTITCIFGVMFLEHFFSYQLKHSIKDLFVIILITHIIIDFLKCMYRKSLDKQLANEDIDKELFDELDKYGFYSDQALHMIVLFSLI